MAVRDPVKQSTASPNTLVTVLWEQITESDTTTAWDSLGPLKGRLPTDIFFRATGTAGGATLALLGSMDGTNFTPALDSLGTAITVTDAAGDDASIPAVASQYRYWKVTTASGSSSDLDAYLDIYCYAVN